MTGEFVEGIIIFLVIIFGISRMVKKNGINCGCGTEEHDADEAEKDETEYQKKE